MKGFKLNSTMYGTLGSVLAYSLAIASPAAAQATDQPTENEEAATAGEIIVTAQFREQRLQDTPIAITALSAEMLDARGQQGVEQIANQAPNVTLKPGGAASGPSLIGYIRGVGQFDYSPALEPGVGLYVDDVYYSTLTGSVLDLLDLDRIEVLRGPQGTLAGKNSIGGSIKLFSRRPDGNDGGSIEIGYGSYSAMSVRASANLTIAPDRLFVRVSGVAKKRDGYVTRLDYACTHPGSNVPTFVNNTGCKLGTEGGVDYQGARASLRWVPSSTFEATLTADVGNDRSEPPANVLLAVAPSALSVGIDTDNNPNTGEVGSFFGLFPYQSGYDVSWNAPGALGACRYIAYGASSCDPLSPNDPYVNYATYQDPRQPGTGGFGASGFTPLVARPLQKLKSYGVSLQMQWNLTDDLQLKSISAYRHYSTTFVSDADTTPLPGDILVQGAKHRQASQELRLSGKIGSLLDFTVGGFYFDQRTVSESRVDLPAAGLDFISGPDIVPARTWALFAHGDVHLTDKATLTLGVRHTDDKKKYIFHRSNPDGSAVCSGGYNCALIGLDGLSDTARDTHVDYRAALSYEWSRDFMTYAQVSTGIKGGGINPQPYYPQQVLPFGPEKLTAFEVGFKSQLLDRKVTLNGAAFYNDYKDIQLNLLECSAYAGVGFGFPCLLRANAASAHVKGVELEAEIHPDDHLSIDGSVSYLDFKYTQIDPSSLVPQTAVTPYTPKWKWSAGIQYELDLNEMGTLTPRLDASYQSNVFTNAINTPLSRIKAYTLLNGRLTWQPSNRDWQVSLEVQNLTDKLYYLTVSDFTGIGNGYASGQPGLPRTFTVRVKRDF